MRDRIFNIIWENNSEDDADAIIAALPNMIAPLDWDIDGRRFALDDSILMGKGYDWDGYEIMREEAVSSFGFGYIIWPDTISSNMFSLYCTLDGLYCQSLFKGKAKAAANTHHRAAIMAAFGGDL
jgi:hypothetical protein